MKKYKDSKIIFIEDKIKYNKYIKFEI